MLTNIQTAITLLTVIVLLVIIIMNLYGKYKTQGKEAALQELREIAYALFLKAEEKFGPKTGPQKMAWAITAFYKYITKDKFTEILPDTTVEKFLQDTFDKGYEKLKDFLDDGHVNGSITAQQ